MKKQIKIDWLELILGVVLILLSLYTFANPDTTILAAVYLYGVVAIVTGIFDIMLYVKLERRTGFGPMVSLLAGIFSLLAGCLILFNPAAATWALSLLFPLWFISHCISRLANLSIISVVPYTVYYYFSMVINIIGLVLGIMLLFQPIISLFAFSYLIGGYLIILGVGNIVMAFSGVTQTTL